MIMQYFPDNAFEILYQSEERHFWFKVRNKIIGNMVSKYSFPQARILEVGCGTGYVSWYLKELGYDIECADIFQDALLFCKKRNAGNAYHQYNLLDQKFIEEFDGICAFDVIEHINDDNAALKNIHDALKPGGIVFITVPANECLWSAMDIYAEHKRRYSLSELREKVEGNGFKVIKLTYFMTFLYPIIYILRKLSVGNMNEEQIKKEVIKELHPNTILNAIFFYIFSLEVPLIRLFNFPFGSSLLCVAIKEDRS